MRQNPVYFHGYDRFGSWKRRHVPGMGVMPDAVVRPSYESWLVGEDKVLEAAMR